MNIKASKKMEIFEPSIFGKLKQAADATTKSGIELINLSIGSPDLPPHEIIRNVLAEKVNYRMSTVIHLGEHNDFIKL